jgi:DUF1680 family protein
LAEQGYKSLDVRDNTCELCEVADMVGLALKLTQAGAGNYWEDADRWLRNQYVEGQLTHNQLRVFLDNLYARELFQERPVKPWESDDIERAIGGFSISSLPNDWGLKMGHACCTGNASRTYYWIWDSILTKQDDLTKVNLLLNRASPWLDVDSYLPNQGKVALKIKQADAVSVRIPEWTDHARVTCNVDGTERSFTWSGDYVQVGGLKPGAVATIEFPIRERTLFRLIGDIPYKVTIRGNTVVDMESAITDTESVLTVTGEAHLREGGYPDALRKEPFAPLYQRDEYRTTETPTKKTTRFVPDELIEW